MTFKKSPTLPYTPERAWNYVLWLLNRRAYSEKEMVEKLQKKSVSEKDIADILAKLRSYKLINDQQFAETITRNERTFVKSGKYKIKQKLMHKGIPNEIQSSIIETIDEETEMKNALYNLEKNTYKWEKFDVTDREQKWKLYQKMMLFLSSKGFEIDICKEVIEKYLHSRE